MTENIEITPPNFKDPRIKYQQKNQSSIYLNQIQMKELNTL